jgi:TRAP-type C4-dicarboxylate transport system permease small subunit
MPSLLALTERLGKALRWCLEWITIILMIGLTVIVIVAVIYRIFGNSLSWYDEVAAIALSWVTYYGAALAALRRGHIGFDSVLLSIPMPWRMVAVTLAEILVLGFFFLMAKAGLQVLEVLEGDALVSLTWVPVQLTQSVIPVGAILFIAAELISLPRYWRQIADGQGIEHREPDEMIEG